MSTELKVLRKYYAKLLTLLKGEILSMSGAAHAAHLLSSGEHDQCTHMMYTSEQKADFFLKSVCRKVEVNPNAFYTLLKVLEGEPSFSFIVDGMAKDIRKMNQNPPPVLPGPVARPEPPVETHVQVDDGDIGIDLDLVDGTLVLNMDDDFADVKEELATLAPKYYSLGQALRVRVGTLDVIKNNHHGNMGEALDAVITEWLKQNYNIVRFGVPTWRLLVQAVAQPTGGGDGALARKIAGKHKAIIGQAQS